MTREEYLLLYEKHLAGKATPLEIEKIMAYEDDFELKTLHPEEDKDRYRGIETRLLSKLDESLNMRKHAHFRFTWQWAAAAVVLIFMGAALFYIAEPDKRLTVATRKNQIKHAYTDSSKAILTLANGKTIELNTVGNATILAKGQVTIKKQQDGILQYEVPAPLVTGEVEYNTISTPRGGQYQIILPDGSKVWLNAASTLRFPVAFTGAERKVELSGEGYFEVAKNKKMPFKVAFKDEEVEVLGTHFNITAYPGVEASKTTLLEGSVAISRGRAKKLLVPGQQAQLQPDMQSFDIQDVDVEEAIAWKSGIFLFHNARITAIMQQIARWYDVDVVYKGDLQNMVFGGRISRSKSLTEVLKNLELTGTIHFKTEGRRVTVME
ncbi:FecR domain-containing protein [Mucilaginibacter sp. PAMB04168]|uniref:FecR family protein n=1 Tax=Mucilaginibacter sp. PAMB04168 TaxID=3138567 RepID=UPI0031F659BF